MRDIVEYQAQNLWFIIPQIFGFLTFFIAGVAVTHRHPFDQPEAEQELADGYHIEYAGMKWGMFFVGEYIGIVLISALLVTLVFRRLARSVRPPAAAPVHLVRTENRVLHHDVHPAARLDPAPTL